MKKLLFLLLIIGFIPSISLAMKVKVGSQLPSVTVEGNDDYGLMNLKGENITFSDWKSSSVTGKVRTIYMLHATGGAADVNMKYTDALGEAEFSDSSYQTITVLNMDEALWGTSGIVRSTVKDKQKEFPTAGFVLDEDGVAQKKFGLKTESAVIIIDTNGKVLFAKDGQLSSGEIRTSHANSQRQWCKKIEIQSIS